MKTKKQPRDTEKRKEKLLCLWDPEAPRGIKTSHSKKERGRGDRKSRWQTDSGEKTTGTKWSKVCHRLWVCNEVCVCVCVFLRGKTKALSCTQALNYLPSTSCWFLCRLLLLSGLFRYHGDWRGAAALQASARFVRSCVQVNTFCSRPSVQAQICMRVGRLGWKR